MRTQRGVTLIELMVTLVILVIGLILAVPSFVEARQRSAVRAAAEAHLTLLAEQRMAGIRQNAQPNIDFTLVPLPSGVTVSAYTMSGPGGDGTVQIDPRNGLLTDASTPGRVTITAGAYSLRFSIGRMGRGSICEVTNGLGYPVCT